MFGRTRFVKGIVNRVTVRFCNACDVVVAPSQAVARELGHWGVKEPKIRIVPTGLDPYFLARPTPEELAEARTWYAGQVVLYVGRLSQEKCLGVLLRAFSKVLIQHPSATLVLAGSGPKERRLKRMVRRLGIRASVDFRGYLAWQHLKPLYWIADVFCMPSAGETQGLSIQEAKACETPCVVLNSLGAGESIENGVDGLLVDEQESTEGTADAFAAAITSLLRDKDSAHRMGLRAQERAMMRTIDTSTKELLDLLREP